MTRTPFRPLYAPLFAAVLAVSLAGPAVLGAHAAEPAEATIQVSATGNANIAPDMAIVNLSVLREADTAREALDANTKATAQVLQAMKDEGIEDRDLQTSNFSIQPRYFYPPRKKDGSQEQPRIVGYTVSNSLTVRIRDLTRVGAILDKSVTLGVNSGGQIQFSNSKPEEAINTAREAAVRNALAKAQTLTTGLGVEIGRVITISEQARGRPAPRGIARMAKAMVADEAAPVPVAAGENTYSVTVSVRWAIKQ
ncbi:MAG: SIMPL domain-containing protein [Pseudomonadota bacterium]